MLFTAFHRTNPGAAPVHNVTGQEAREHDDDAGHDVDDEMVCGDDDREEHRGGTKHRQSP